MSGISVSGVKAGEFCQPQTAAPEGKNWLRPFGRSGTVSQT